MFLRLVESALDLSDGKSILNKRKFCNEFGVFVIDENRSVALRTVECVDQLASRIVRKRQLTLPCLPLDRTNQRIVIRLDVAVLNEGTAP